MAGTKPKDSRFLPPGPGGDEGGKRAPGSRWPADEWGNEPYWKQEPAGEQKKEESKK